MARQSTRKKPAGKFPLTLHRTSQWCKKVRGKLLYFGKDEKAALNRWLDEKDELLERVLKAVAEQPVAAAGNYFASLRSGSKAGTVDMFLDLSTGWL